MTTFLAILLAIFAAGTLYMLARGVIGMARGGDVTGQRSQDWMRKRVLFQAAAVVLVILLLIVAGGRG